jgi:L-seryl-tRNA(Ser) seleniumtransferase
MHEARNLPSIEQLRQRPAMLALAERFGRTAVVEALRAEADALRAALESGTSIPDIGTRMEAGATARLHATQTGSLRAVINATGVILHTNLGRAPLGEPAAISVARLASGYTNLEYDLVAGSRGRRDTHAEHLLTTITGAEAACVVNNNAAATLLTLAALGAGREVIVSRGELVEIGGGFRVPDVMQQSGAQLREVGTTNRTRAADYAAAIGERTALILRVHPSNFRIEGFTERPALEELVALGRRFKIPVVEDLGSGLLKPSEQLRAEPSVSDTIAAGADVVMFSGDKLLGGPQAGIIAGTRAQLDPIRRHPLMRALRVDKMTYAALEATLQAHAAGHWNDLPVMLMLTTTKDAIATRAEALARAVVTSELRALPIDGESTIGGGSAPGETLPTCLVELHHSSLSADALESRLRSLDRPVIARIQNDRVVLDLRTVPAALDTELARLVGAAISR